MKVSCFTCKYFIKTFAHNSENNISKDNLLLCNKIGFRIFDYKNPKIHCNLYSPVEPSPKPGNYIGNKSIIKSRFDSA